MAELSDDGGTPASVTIFGRTYHLRGHGDPGYLQELAQVVDRRMREVVDATGTADTVKVAILAALNLADESLQASRGDPRGRRGPRETERRLARLVTMLDEALAE